MSARALLIAAVCELLYAALLGFVALGIPVEPSPIEQRALVTLGIQAGLALLAATGLLRGRRWGWLAALTVIVLAWGPVVRAAFYAWANHVGLAIPLPAGSLMFAALVFLAQLATAICFLVARGWRPSAPRTP